MAILNDQLREQLRARFADTLKGDVELMLYVRPGTGRLILPAGLGCATCDDARELIGEVRDAAPERISLEVVDLAATRVEGVEEIPALDVAPKGQTARIRFHGLPAGFEFATVVDAVERASSGELGLRPETLAQLERLTEPLEVMVFATPT
jgi:alkyl hydroperoxide reductase subunit AhpF